MTSIHRTLCSLALVVATVTFATAAAAGPLPEFGRGPEGSASPPVLYVSDFESGDVVVFPQAGQNQQPVRALTGLEPTIGLALDKRRHLYVAQPGSVLEFAPGGSVPLATFADTGHDPGGVAICPNGTLYVANSEGVTLSVYAKGATSPTGTLSAGSQVFHVACDAASDVFVTVGGSPGQVDEFLANGMGPINLPISLNFPEGIAIDRAGDVVVADSKGQHLAFYHVGQNTPFRTLAVPGAPLELSFSDSDRFVWVTVNGAVERYDVRTGRLVDRITRLASPGGLAVSPAD